MSQGTLGSVLAIAGAILVAVAFAVPGGLWFWIVGVAGFLLALADGQMRRQERGR